MDNNLSLTHQLNLEAYNFIQNINKIYLNHGIKLFLDKQLILQNVTRCIKIDVDQGYQSDAEQKLLKLPNFIQQLLEYRDQSIQQEDLKIDGNNEDQKQNRQQNQNKQPSIQCKPPTQIPKQLTTTQLKQDSEDQSYQMYENLSSQFFSTKKNNSQLIENQFNQKKKKRSTHLPNQSKLHIINQSSKFGSKIISSKYGIPISTINSWSRIITKRKGKRGRKPFDIQMEKDLCQWIICELGKGKILTQKNIREKAKTLSTNTQFSASKGWLQKLFKRKPQIFKAYSQSRTSNYLQNSLRQLRRQNLAQFKQQLQSKSQQDLCQSNESNEIENVKKQKEKE